jgi:uncharacterized protein YukE
MLVVPLTKSETMKKLLVISIMILFCVTVIAQKKVEKQQVSSKVLVQDDKVILRAVKTDLNSKNLEAQKLLNELQAIINKLPNEINIDDLKKKDDFLDLMENFDQKVSQLFDILSTISKTSKETESSLIQNITEATPY